MLATVPFQSPTVAKLDTTSGTLAWSRPVGYAGLDGPFEANAVSVGPRGNVAVAGSLLHGVLTLDRVRMQNEGNRAAAVVVLDSTGTAMWAWVAPFESSAFAIAFDACGNVIVAGGADPTTALPPFGSTFVTTLDGRGEKIDEERDRGEIGPTNIRWRGLESSGLVFAATDAQFAFFPADKFRHPLPTAAHGERIWRVARGGRGRTLLVSWAESAGVHSMVTMFDATAREVWRHEWRDGTITAARMTPGAGKTAVIMLGHRNTARAPHLGPAVVSGLAGDGRVSFTRVLDEGEATADDVQSLGDDWGIVAGTFSGTMRIRTGDPPLAARQGRGVFALGMCF